MTTGASQDGDTGTLELINSELAARFARQDEAGRGIDTKATTVAGFAAVAAQFLATRHTQPILAGLAYAAYAVAFGLAMWTLAVAKYNDPPKPRHLVERYAREPQAKALSSLIVQRVKAIENNTKKHYAKAWRWRYSVVALTLGLVLSVAAI